MLRYHRAVNPDGPYRVELCESPTETGTTWDCAPNKVKQLRREARAMVRRALRAIAATAIPYEANWDRVADCESSGNWSINTGNGYYGGLQFSLGTWAAYGGQGRPDLASKRDQILVAERVRTQSGLHHWPVCGSRW